MSAPLAVSLALTLVAFAANSVLCRLALSVNGADAAAFTWIRIASGAATLLLITRGHGIRVTRSSLLPAAMLFTYAAGFSFAYLELTAGTGALLLFGAVQATMLIGGLIAGERPKVTGWIGWALAFAGLVYLVLPGLDSPPVRGASLMLAAGVAWGVYSLLGRSNTDPTLSTARNFTLACLPALFLLPATVSAGSPGVGLVWLAIASGALTSALGYVLWYWCLRQITSISAAVAQLSVPLIAAVGGVILLSETLTARLLVSALLILGGIAKALKSASSRP